MPQRCAALIPQRYPGVDAPAPVIQSGAIIAPIARFEPPAPFLRDSNTSEIGGKAAVRGTYSKRRW